MWFDRFWRIEITFTWKADDILNKRIERKIMWFFTKTVELKKKELEERGLEKEELKKEKKKRKKEEN
jgi:hypothetical protein